MKSLFCSLEFKCLRQAGSTLFTCLCFLYSFPHSSIAQPQTVGLFLNDSSSFQGYTLLAPVAARETYLIDNCGREVHRWQSQYRPGEAAYFLLTGELLRTARIPGAFGGGGTGGRVERFDWEGNLTWGYDYATQEYHQHHDVEWLPNGNVLILAWERRSNAEAIAAGRDPNTLINDLWPEQIVEVEPIEPDSGRIIWEWHLWDHVIQDFDSTKDNFGDVAAHPELVDLNYQASFFGTNNADWIHANSVAYSPKLDQIILNSRNFGEFWIIDHSTTTEEAASHSGGNAGKGGDLLYRWGNPQVYRRGTPADQQLFGQHDVHWIPAGRPDSGKIMIYNNGFQRPDGNYSSVEILIPPIDSLGRYQSLDSATAYGPEQAYWTYTDSPKTALYSQTISGANRLPNGNTLICDGPTGRLFEIDTLGRLVWDYESPVGPTGPFIQGSNPIGNRVFRAYRFGPDFPGLAGRVLTPGDPIELNPLPSDCMLYGGTMGIAGIPGLQLSIGPNPFAEKLSVQFLGPPSLRLQIVSITGERLFFGDISQSNIHIQTHDWPPGIYLLHVEDPHTRRFETRKLLRK